MIENITILDILLIPMNLQKLDGKKIPILKVHY